MSTPETYETGGALTKRTVAVSVIDDEAGIADLLSRLRSAQPLSAQIVDYFNDLRRRVAEVAGVIVHANDGLTLPGGLMRPDPDWLLVEEFSELRDAIFVIRLGDDGLNQRQLAPASQLAAVARAFYAGRLAQERHLSKHEPDTERGIRDGRQREDARTMAATAKEARADIWRAKAVQLARSMVVPTKQYSAHGVAGDVRAALVKWLPGEYDRLGFTFDPAKDVPALGTIRKAISATKIIGNIR